MRIEDFKKTVEERKTYVEDKIKSLKQKFNYKHQLMFDDERGGYKKLMEANRGKDFYEDTKEGQELFKLKMAVEKREEELVAVEAYLKVLN
jgi:hypothetical protein